LCHRPSPMELLFSKHPPGEGVGQRSTRCVLRVDCIGAKQEIIFIISMAVVCYMLVLVTAELDHNTRMGILFATIIVFA
jgi:hypothetical protein